MGKDDEPHHGDPSLTQRLLEEGQRRLHESRRLLQDLFGDERGTSPEPDDEHRGQTGT